MKQHLKRHHAPKTWPIKRKGSTFIIRPFPSSHGKSLSVPLGVVLRDMLSLVDTTAEAARIMQHEEILVDCKRRRDVKHTAGLFDIISFPKTGESYRMSLDENGRLSLVKIPSTEDKTKVCSVVSKTTLTKGITQIGLHDGRTLNYEGECKVGDSLIIELPNGRVIKHIPLKEGSFIFLKFGAHAGEVGVIKKIIGDIITYGDKDTQTKKEYAVVVGQIKAEVTVR